MNNSPTINNINKYLSNQKDRLQLAYDSHYFCGEDSLLRTIDEISQLQKKILSFSDRIYIIY